MHGKLIITHQIHRKDTDFTPYDPYNLVVDFVVFIKIKLFKTIVFQTKK